MTSNDKLMALAADFLERYAERLGNAGCNDWQWPAGWSADERRALVTAMVADNVGRSPVTFTDDDRDDVNRLSGPGEYGPPDFWVCGFLARKIKAELEREGG